MKRSQVFIEQLLACINPRALCDLLKVPPLKDLDNSNVKEQIDTISSHRNMEEFLEPNLLSSLVENVMSNDFFSLYCLDSLSHALALITLRNAKEIIIVDQDNKFFGIASNLSVLKLFPPAENNVPQKNEVKQELFNCELNRLINETSRKTILEALPLEKLNRTHLPKILNQALDELTKPSLTYFQPKIIPILNPDETVAGVVSWKEALKQIRYSKVLGNVKVKDLLELNKNDDFIYTLSSKSTLEQAYFAFEYIPTDYIVVVDEGQFSGIIQREKVVELSHPMYWELMSISLDEVMFTQKEMLQDSKNKKFSLVQENYFLESVISDFLEYNTEALIVATGEQSNIVEEGKADVIPTYIKGIITPVNILQFYQSQSRT